MVSQAPQKDLSHYVVSDPQRLGGEPIFAGSRVPVRTLFTYLRKNLGIEQFLSDFEGVGRDQVQAVLQVAESDIIRQIHRA